MNWILIVTMPAWGGLLLSLGLIVYGIKEDGEPRDFLSGKTTLW